MLSLNIAQSVIFELLSTFVLCANPKLNPKTIPQRITYKESMLQKLASMIDTAKDSPQKIME